MKENFQKIKKQPAYALVFEAIERKILAGDLAVGDVLPTEHELCEQFGVQRSTIREGVRLLEQSGLVSREGGKRLQVIRPQTNDEAQRTRQGLARHGVTFAEVWETTVMFMPQIVRRAAQKADERVWETLDDVTARLRKADGADEIVSLTAEFYEALTAATENRVLDVMIKSMNMLTLMSFEQVVAQLPNAGRRSAKMFAAITDALRSRDPDRAAEFTEKHLNDLRRGYSVAGVPIDAEIGVYEAGATRAR